MLDERNSMVAHSSGVRIVDNLDFYRRNLEWKALAVGLLGIVSHCVMGQKPHVSRQCFTRCRAIKMTLISQRMMIMQVAVGGHLLVGRSMFNVNVQ